MLGVNLDPQALLYGLARLPLLIIALSIHEWAHAWMAYRLGDNTAKLQGRLTLNPVAHMDLIGSLVVPILTLGGFGWAKPVPFTATALSRKLTMRAGVALVALAGPVSNLLQALVGTIIFGVVAGLAFRFGGPDGPSWYPVFQDFALGDHRSRGFIELNCVLAVFNLLPVNPLDGGKVLYGVLPRRAGDALIENEYINRYGFLVLLLIFFVATPVARVLMWPAIVLTDAFAWLASVIAGVIA